MRRFASKARRPSHGVARIAAITLVLAGTGMAVSGATPAAGQQVAKPQLNYDCAYPSGLPESNVQVGVQVEASFPQTGAIGQPIQPTSATVAIVLPPAAVANLARLHAATVAADYRLRVRVAQNGASASDPWTGQTAAGTPLPAQGNMVLSATGTVQPTIVRAAGDVTFTAAAISVLLAPRTATGAATNPAMIPLSCQLVPGQQATLATVPVGGAGGSPAPQPAGHGQSNPISVGPMKAAAAASCPPYPKGGYKFNPRFHLPSPPPGSTVTFPTPQQACSFIVGFSNAQKLNEAALVGPGISGLSVNIRVVQNLKTHYFQLDSAGQLFYKPCATCRPQNALPPAHATFLSFGFMPTSATLQITQIGTLNVASVGTTSALKFSRIWSEASIRVSDVQVNGVPLNVGNNCRTAKPFRLVLTGKPPYTLQQGGVLTGTVTIPPFTGCGVTENLNAVFNATVSGPGNFVKITQGNLCTPGPPPFGCPPIVPKPVH